MNIVLHMSVDDLLGWILLGIIIVLVIVWVAYAWIAYAIDKCKRKWKARKAKREEKEDKS